MVFHVGAIERDGLLFIPEFNVINQDGAIHVYKQGEFVEELRFNFSGNLPEEGKIEELVNAYCQKHSN